MTKKVTLFLRKKKKTVKENYKVKDLALADWGRKEIQLAEAEMPGLIALREEFGAVSYTHLTLPTILLV